VFSLHCKQFFPPELISNVKCINIHPGYNPLNRGWYPQVFSIIHDLPIGATIHEIDNKLDHGPIIDREFVQKYIYDTSESLYNRVLDMEIQLLKKNLLPILKNDYSILIPEEEGNLFLKKDFNNLLEIDLNKEYKAIDLINILRALTHGKYSNAFYYNKSNGRKIFISINLHEE
jgi:methionyl-tRNA formyltransferase